MCDIIYHSHNVANPNFFVDFENTDNEQSMIG